MSKTIIITGASGGLGKTVVSSFLDKGFQVLATVRTEAAITELAPHPNLTIKVVDLSSEEASATFVHEAIQANGTVEAALLLAGGFAMGQISSTSDLELEKQFNINFSTAYHITRPLLDHMAEREYGRIVFVGARLALEPAQGKNAVAYALSKSLLFSLASLINAEHKSKNIVATVVTPSTIDTPANRAAMPDAPFSNWVSATQLAELFHFVCSDLADPLRETVLKVYHKA